MPTVILENDQYVLEIVESPDVNLRRQFYGMKNKNTGVIENYFSGLAEALVEMEKQAFILRSGIPRIESDRYIEGMRENYFPAREDTVKPEIVDNKKFN